MCSGVLVCVFMLKVCRENEVVGRGFQAVIMIYQLTNRVPALIKQSHLERKEGRCPCI